MRKFMPKNLFIDGGRPRLGIVAKVDVVPCGECGSPKRVHGISGGIIVVYPHARKIMLKIGFHLQAHRLRHRTPRRLRHLEVRATGGRPLHTGNRHSIGRKPGIYTLQAVHGQGGQALLSQKTLLEQVVPKAILKDLVGFFAIGLLRSVDGRSRTALGDDGLLLVLVHAPEACKNRAVG